MEPKKYFVGVDNLLEITDGIRGITLYHYPLLTWKRKLRTYVIHGHIHNDTTSGYFPLIATQERMLNAGVGISGFRPVTFEEMVENNRLFKEQFLQEQYCHLTVDKIKYRTAYNVGVNPNFPHYRRNFL